MAEFSRMDSGGKKDETTSVRFNDSQKAFIKGMVRLHGMDSESDFVRHLVDRDMSSTANNLKLMAEALGVKVITENSVFGVYDQQTGGDK